MTMPRRTSSYLVTATILALLSLVSRCQETSDIDPDAIPPIPIQEPCNPTESRLDPITHKFRSNCGPRQWCKPTTALDHDPLLGLPTSIPAPPSKRDLLGSLATISLPSTQTLLKLSGPSTTLNSLSPTATLDFGLCVDKGCRRDEYPFGYRGVLFEALPPQCSEGQFCPDDESSCQPLLALGQPCQLNRDDSCQKAGDSPYRALCLQGQCRLAKTAVNDICILDSTEYLGYNESGLAIISTISRDDCQSSLYCEEATSRCLSEKANGLSCSEDRECINYNCDKNTLSCQDAPFHLHRLPLWAWSVIVLIILTALISLVFGLYKIHLNHRALRSEEIDQFFSQQWQYRHSILSMHAAAATASLHRQSQSTFYPSIISSSSMILNNKSNDQSQSDQQQGKDSSWASALQIKPSSPIAIHGTYSTATLSPRLCHRRSPSQ